MLPINRINLDTRHRTDDSKSTSDFNIHLPSNITLPYNAAFYITDITVPVRWYTVEVGRNGIIGFIDSEIYDILFANFDGIPTHGNRNICDVEGGVIW